MTDNRRMAIVLHHPHQLDDARYWAAQLSDAGSTVVFYCLCGRQCPPDHWNIETLLENQATCYTDSHDLADRYDLECLSAASLVKHLKMADWVIPF